MPSFHGVKVLVTGATGFVGGHLARRLLSEGAVVTLLVRSTSDPKTLEDFKTRGARLVTGDITSASSALEACAGQTFVFHCAALYREAKFPDEAYMQVNFEGTKILLEACKASGVKRIVHTSTIGVHSHIENPPANESEPYLPTDVYQVSKTEAEKFARARFESGEIDGVVIRPAMIWGEGDRRIFKLFKGIATRRLPIIGSGLTWTHWIYVQDLVDAYLLAATVEAARAQVYIIAGRRPVLMKDVFSTIAGIAGVKPLPFRIPAWPIQFVGSCVETVCSPFGIEPPLHRRRADFFVKNRWFDTSKAQRELGFKPRFEFEEEARLVYSWYRENGWL
ncbi:MAG: NAD-dependent epimerase/dehydratase family protein [Deltaproteobacteria bacterium]|nr:NAD-dependent epimerase/dehydratase family protein [Deltaproteobacteria bacterium]